MRLHKKFGFLIGVSAPIEEVNNEVFDTMYDTAEQIEGVDDRTNLQVVKGKKRLYIFSPHLNKPHEDLIPTPKPRPKDHWRIHE